MLKVLQMKDKTIFVVSSNVSFNWKAMALATRLPYFIVFGLIQQIIVAQELIMSTIIDIKMNKQYR